MDLLTPTLKLINGGREKKVREDARPAVGQVFRW